LLEEQERQKIRIWANATKEITSMDGGSGSLLIDIVRENTTIPVILTLQGKLMDFRNLDSSLMSDSNYVKSKIAYMQKQNTPMEIEFSDGVNLVS
jgi:hypothetical protein